MITSLTGSQTIKANNSALLLNIKGIIVDQPSYDNALKASIEEMMGNDPTKYKENSVFELIDKINQAKNDPQITGLVLLLNNFYGANSTNLQALGLAIKEFKSTKKPVIAFADSMDQQRYYLASFANEVHLTPYGFVDIHGLGTTGFYFKSLLDKLGINTHIFRVGTHKSAVEPYIRDDMSPEAKAMTERFLSILWKNYLQDVSLNRGFKQPNEFFKDSQLIVEQLTAAEGSMSNMALNNNWVDKLSTRDQIWAHLDSIFDNYPQPYISIYEYELKEDINTLFQPANIAIIHIEGPIVDGNSGPGYTGAETISQQINDARQDDNIKGLILRVNSPGGSVTAAELILSSLVSFKKENKPIVASFGSVAASGGYWIATAADKILANQNTITGSIGIFGIIQTFEETLSKVGVFSQSLSTTDFGTGTVTEPLSEDLKSLIQLNIQNGYQRFLSLVAQSRSLSIDEVDHAAQGQVWIAEDALKHKLIDQIGNLDEAITLVATLAKIDAPKTKWYRSEPTFWEAVVIGMNASLDNKLNAFIPENLQPYINALSVQEALLKHTIKGYGGIQTFAVCELCENDSSKIF